MTPTSAAPDADRLPAALVAAAAALAVGATVYLGARPGGQAQWLPGWLGADFGNPFGTLAQWLPSFVHPFSFGIFTAAALPRRTACSDGACAAWALVNVAFESGQHPQLKGTLAAALDAASGADAWQPLARYFLRGTFDPGDIVAALLGAFVAAALLRSSARPPLQRAVRTVHGPARPGRPHGG